MLKSKVYMIVFILTVIKALGLKLLCSRSLHYCCQCAFIHWITYTHADSTAFYILQAQYSANCYSACTSLSLWYYQIEDAVQPVDIAMKNILYSMLSAEGSYKSQEVCSHILRKMHV